MTRQLTSRQLRYLRERGFEVRQGTPAADEPHPYITLKKPADSVWDSEITFHQTDSSDTGNSELMHPYHTDKPELVEFIERLVAEDMGLEGRLYRTAPGRPIKLFVVDPAWQDTADALAKKYCSEGQAKTKYCSEGQAKTIEKQ